jgi:hypothetical protein
MTSDANEARRAFLLEMYRQTSSHLNRHILLSWQSIGVVGGALAVFVLGDKLELKADVRLDFAIGVVVLLCAWSIAHVFDANNWFERNLHIITNIERQFLNSSDLREIHFYFDKHRRDRTEKWLIKHFEIQLLMTVGLWVILIAYHVYQRVWIAPKVQLVAMTPYVVSILCAIFCYCFAKGRKADYEVLRKASPGRDIQPAAREVSPK